MAKVEDTILSGGQNESIDRAVLALPGLSRVVNARLRKSARWGKRFGFSLLPSANLSAAPGYARGLGEGFAIVDDQCNRWDQVAGAWVNLANIASGDPYRKAGAVSGFLPDKAFFPAPNRSIADQTRTACDAAFFLGYLWTVKLGKTDPGGNVPIRVTAVDPNDQTLVFLRDFTVFNARAPKLTVIGSTLALAYLTGPSVSGSLVGRRLTSLAGGFGPEIILSLEATVYDISTLLDAGIPHALLAVADGTGMVLSAVNAALVLVESIIQVETANLTSISIVGSATLVSGRIHLGYGMAGPLSRVRVFDAGFVAIGAPVTLSSTDDARPLLALLPNGDARVTYSAIERTTPGGLKIGAFAVATVSAAAALGPVTRQLGAYPIAIPFTIGTRAYQWCQLLINQPTVGAGGYPVLLRVDVSLSGGTTSSFPIEMSVQDFITSTGAGLSKTELTGLPRVPRFGSERYAALIPILYRAPVSTADIMIDFRLVQIRQFTGESTRRGLTSFAADSAQFVPMGALTRIDARGAVESGFVHTPQIATPIPGAGGGLTPNKTYYYAAIFVSRNDSGRIELSGPSLPTKAVMGASQNANTVTITNLYLTARPSAEIELYRTLADTQSFYLIATLSCPQDVDRVEFIDQLSDATIATRPVIYTQVGQQLGNGFPPGCRFGCTGGGRIFVAGLLRPDVAVASKLILGDQSPSFADSDAFKVILPAAITGIAWMDSLTLFTREGIYVASGEGPTDDGVGDFGTPSRLPFQIGSIEPRAVITIGEGTFFQSNRGLYLLPRGFGEPVGAGDAVMQTLRDFPIITSAVAMVKDTEQTIRWTCVTNELESTQRGRTIVYDVVHKAWSIDTSVGRAGGIDGPSVCAGNWFEGEIAAPDPIAPALIKVTTDGFADASLASAAEPIEMILETGDIRPFGLQSRGAASRFSILSELRSACTLNVERFSDRGESPATPRVFSGIAPDDGIGTNNYTQVDLGSAELRSLASLRIRLSERSATEGLAFIGLSLEHGSADGLRLDKPADRIV